MDAVFRLVPGQRARAVEHGVGDFLAAVGRQAVQELSLIHISEQMGPYYYNQGVQDAQILFRDKLEDAVYEIEKPFVD